MKNRRDILIIAALFIALILFVALGPGRQPPQEPNTATTHSSADGGALAFYTWARAMGYDARRLEYRSFALADEDAALVILNPSEAISRAQARDTLAWVERGGTLIVADDTSIVFSARNELFDELKVDQTVYSSTAEIERADQAQPALDQPAVGPALVRTGRALAPRRSDYVKLLGPPDAIVMLGIKHGRGYVYLSASAYPFTNEGLRDAANAALALNLLRRVPSGGRVQFDEYHHGYFTPPAAGSFFLNSPWGWAAAYAIMVIALFLILSGRRFGRPIPLAEEVARRSSAEYVESMAELFRRGGKRGYILRHYRAALKRRLARPYGVNPQIDDAEFVRELARFRELDEPALLALLARMRGDRADEAELVRTVAEAEQILASEGRRI